MRKGNEKFTLNLSISIWLMSSDWGRNLSATRLRRAGGLSVSSGTSSVSWDSELSPPPITPPPLPPVNAPPDTIYVIRAKCLRYLLPSCVSSFSSSKATRAFRERRPSRSKDASEIKTPLTAYSTVSFKNRPNLPNVVRTSLERNSSGRTDRSLSPSFSLFHFLTSICIPLSPLLHLAFRAALLPFFLSLLLLQTSGPNLNIFG